jgi:DNA repair protein SbcD/Mre11
LAVPAQRAGRQVAFRFVHTADLHLDSPLRSLALRDPRLADEVASATRDALSRIVDLCLAEQVHALLIAGDLWDGTQTSAKTPAFLKAELARLGATGIRTFIIRGNHDARSVAGRDLQPPDGTHIFGARAATELLDAGGHRVAIHGISFAQPQVTESLLPRYPAPVPGAINIGMMHTSLDGSPNHDAYAPCKAADLDGFGYDYWALGHIHRRSVQQGRAAIVMPGIPQGRDMGETGDCSVSLVTLADNVAPLVETRTVGSVRFERADLEISGIADWSRLVDGIGRGLREAADRPRPEPHLVLRLTLTGAGPLAFRLVRDLDLLTAEAAAFAATHPGLWIDRLVNATTPTEDAPVDLPPDLLRLAASDPSADPALAEAILSAARAIAQDLPADLRDMLGEDPDAEMVAAAALLADGMPRLLGRLTADPGGGG